MKFEVLVTYLLIVAVIGIAPALAQQSTGTQPSPNSVETGNNATVTQPETESSKEPNNTLLLPNLNKLPAHAQSRIPDSINDLTKEERELLIPRNGFTKLNSGPCADSLSNSVDELLLHPDSHSFHFPHSIYDNTKSNHTGNSFSSTGTNIYSPPTLWQVPTQKPIPIGRTWSIIRENQTTIGPAVRK